MFFGVIYSTSVQLMWALIFHKRKMEKTTYKKKKKEKILYLGKEAVESVKL